jgi:hypothetical protein
MPCLAQSIVDAHPELQAPLDAVQEAVSLAAMILAALQVGREVARRLVEEQLAWRADQPESWPVCPKCGRKMESKGRLPRQIQSLVGLIRWERRVGRCPRGCRVERVVPLDAALGIAPSQRSSWELQQVACLLAVFVPFDTAAVIVARVAGIAVCDGSIWNWVQAAGGRAITRLNEELTALAQGTAPARESLAEGVAKLALLLGADGVMVPFRATPGSAKGPIHWHEVKLAVLARLDRALDRAGRPVNRLVQRRLVAIRGGIDALGARIQLEALRQGITDAPQVVWISDGGQGLWRLFEERCPNLAIGILDFYHAAAHLWKAADARFASVKRAQAWFTDARHRLRQGEYAELLDELTALIEQAGLPPASLKALGQVKAYLDRHHCHLDYLRFKDLGLPIGSGFVESACKWLIQQRFKGVGMRWSHDGFDKLLHLRLAWANDRFDALFNPPLPCPPN